MLNIESSALADFHSVRTPYYLPLGDTVWQSYAPCEDAFLKIHIQDVLSIYFTVQTNTTTALHIITDVSSLRGTLKVEIRISSIGFKLCSS